ncbi:hypothetical protein YC2023_103805 [Brassica napus]
MARLVLGTWYLVEADGNAPRTLVAKNPKKQTACNSSVLKQHEVRVGERKRLEDQKHGNILSRYQELSSHRWERSFGTQLLTMEARKIWDALRAAAEEDDLSLAQTVIESAGVVVQNADLTICYDEKGKNKTNSNLVCIYQMREHGYKYQQIKKKYMNDESKLDYTPQMEKPKGKASCFWFNTQGKN